MRSVNVAASGVLRLASRRSGSARPGLLRSATVRSGVVVSVLLGSVLSGVSASAVNGAASLYCARAVPQVAVGHPEGSGDSGCWVRAGEGSAVWLATTTLADPRVTFYVLTASGLPSRWDTSSLPVTGEGVSWRVSEAGRVLIVDAAAARAGWAKLVLGSDGQGEVQVRVDVASTAVLSLVNTSRVFDSLVVVHAVDPRLEVVSVTRQDRRVQVTGQVHGLPPGGVVTAHVRAVSDSRYVAGKVPVRVGPDGTFTWSRNLGKKAWAERVKFAV